MMGMGMGKLHTFEVVSQLGAQTFFIRYLIPNVAPWHFLLSPPATTYSTHVASTTCGKTYGVAKDCDLCAVKVLSNLGSGSISGVIEGVDHVAANCPAGMKCVANMSLGGGFSQSLNNAVAAAVTAGVTMVVAAGNENSNACNKSPASAATAITVGSTTSSDARSSFSNFGECLDIYAPGSAIKAAWTGSATATNTISGTSMASPRKF